MIEKNVVLSYKTEKTVDSSNKNKLSDAKFIITPTPFFADEVKQTNFRQKTLSQNENR